MTSARRFPPACWWDWVFPSRWWDWVSPGLLVGLQCLAAASMCVLSLSRGRAEHDDRKLMGTKFIFVMSMVLITAVYYKRSPPPPLPLFTHTQTQACKRANARAVTAALVANGEI